MTPLDLSKHPPRSPRVRLGDLSMLARTIDRARASLPGGDLGGYDPIQSGLSTMLLTALDISPDELVTVVAGAENDAAVAAWVCERTDPAARRAIDDRMSHLRIADLPPERRAHIEAHYPRHLVETCELGFDLLEGDDRESFSNAG